MKGIKINFRKLITGCAVALTVACTNAAYGEYIPSEANLRSREQFKEDRFGIFIHWGIYSMYAHGEWFLNNGNFPPSEYAKAASGFYPSRFDAGEWADAIKESGARYVCFTSRHHDGFSMFGTALSDYNIVDATPYGRDVLKELADALRERELPLHLYYSHIDWTREDYPQGRSGPRTGRDSSREDWESYYQFMNGQLTELLTNYGDIRAIWFDGLWDHDVDTVPFNWELDRQYEMIHTLQPSCLIANNHHLDPFPGEDIQIFERDIPGENTAGYSEQAISRLPLETCQTMNGMWGYKIEDLDYKDTSEIIRLLVRTAGRGANLLLNVGPQPNGELPEMALARLRETGEWLKTYGETIYGTEGAPFEEQSWGTCTVKGDRTFVHVLTPETTEIEVPFDGKVSKATLFKDGTPVNFSEGDGRVILHLDELPCEYDCVIELT